MKIAGIVSEFNPFHRGHEYLIKKTKKDTGAYVIALMSGNFMQRGEPAAFDMGVRTLMALKGGADAVFELPPFFSTASAEAFSFGAVSILDNLNVDILSFGSECGKPLILRRIAEILAFEREEYRLELKRLLKTGISFPAAREQALSRIPELFADGFSVEKLHEILQNPNDILALEYLKNILRSDLHMDIHCVKRIISPYHGNVDISVNSVEKFRETPEKSMFSAESIRKILAGGSIPTGYEEAAAHGYVDRNSMTLPLLLTLLSGDLKERLLSSGMPEELKNRIIKNRYFNGSFEGFCSLLKRKNITYSAISRYLLRLILCISPEINGRDLPGHVRLLGFKKSSAPLLSELKRRSSLKILSNSSDIKKYLKDHPEDPVLEETLRVDRHYELLRSEEKRKEHPLPPEISRKLLILNS